MKAIGNSPYFLVGCGIFSVAAVFTQSNGPGKVILQDGRVLLPHKLKKSRLQRKEADDFVSRPEVRKMLEVNVIKGKYCIVYGNKGVGKSAVVNDMFWDKPGVVGIKVTHLVTSNELVSQLVLKVLGPGASVNVQEEDLITALKSAAEPITIIFEAEPSNSPNQQAILGAVRSLAKSLAPFARCVIVLSEANAVLEFGRDDTRENYVYVGEMTREEAKQLLLKKGAHFTEEELQFIFDNLGTTASRLIHLCMRVPGLETVQAYVARALAKAEFDLQAFPLQSLLSELKKHPDGVSLDVLYGKTDATEKHVRLDRPNSVGPFLKAAGGNIVVYRLELYTYQLLSTPHRV
eukprot:gene41984-51250_t